jgi:hypothetical protein
MNGSRRRAGLSANLEADEDRDEHIETRTSGRQITCSSGFGSGGGSRNPIAELLGIRQAAPNGADEKPDRSRST